MSPFNRKKEFYLYYKKNNDCDLTFMGYIKINTVHKDSNYQATNSQSRQITGNEYS